MSLGFSVAAPKTYRVRERTACRICGGRDLVPYLDLGPQPPSNGFLAPEDVEREIRFPLKVALCPACGLSQLTHVVAAADIFDDYMYLSSTSKALCRHYQGLVDEALERFRPADGSLAVDIGCNDGIMLARFPKGRFRLLGVEPSSAGGHARAAGFEVAAEFFDEALARRLLASHGPARLLTATNVFAHVDDIRSFAAGAEAWLADDGAFILEFPYLEAMIEHCYFDTVYHEHLSYLALTPVVRLFGEVGLRAFRVERVEVGASGPALRLFACRAGAGFATDETIAAMLDFEGRAGVADPGRYLAFATRVSRIRDRILALVRTVRAEGHALGGFAAPAKGNTLLNYLGLTARDIRAISESNRLKVGKLTPGSHIPIVGEDTFLAMGIRYALLLAWNYADFFLAESEYVKRGGRFVVPLPEPAIRP